MGQHYIEQVDESTRTAYCRGCEDVVPVNSNAARGKGWVCAIKARDDARKRREAYPEKLAASHKAWREANPGRMRDYQLQRLYGITLKTYKAAVAEREGRCDICGEVPQGAGPNGLTLCVEHDHETKVIRGYVCSSCNLCIAGAKDSPAILRQAAKYLERAQLRAARALEELTTHC